MPTDEKTNGVISQNSNNGNTGNGGNGSTSANILDTDINLDLDGVELPTRENNEIQHQQESDNISDGDTSLNFDIPGNDFGEDNVVSMPTDDKQQESQDVKVEEDWLLQEDKKVEEIAGFDKSEGGDANVQDNQSLESLDVEESVGQDIHGVGVESDQVNVDFVRDDTSHLMDGDEVAESVSSNEKYNEQNNQDDGQGDLFNVDFGNSDISADNSEEKSTLEETNEQTVESENNSYQNENSEIDDKKGDNSDFEPHIDLDFVSDTGTPVQEGQYVPSEDEYYKIYNALDSAPNGQINISSLHDSKPENKDFDTDEKQKAFDTIKTEMESGNNGMFDLDSITSDLQAQNIGNMSGNLQNDSIDQSNLTNPNQVNKVEDQGQNSVENAVSNQMNTQFAQDNNIENTVNGTVQNVQNIQGTQNISQVVNPQPTSVEYSPVQQSPVVQQNPNIQQIPSAGYVPQQFVQGQQIYTDSNGMQIQGIYPNQPEKTNNHVGLKIILIFLLLLGGGIFILCKMFPSEVNDIIKSIKGEDTTKIEYSGAQNPSDSDSSEGEMTNLEIIDDNEISETIWDTEALDENQLHGSAEELDSSTENEDSFVGSDGLSQLLDAQTNEDENMGQQDEGFQPIDGDGSQESIDMMGELGLLIDDERSDILDMINLLESYEKQGQIYQELGANQNQSTVYKYATFILNKSKSLRETIETTGEMDINSLNQTISQFDSYLSKMSALVSE